MYTLVEHASRKTLKLANTEWLISQILQVKTNLALNQKMLFLNGAQSAVIPKPACSLFIYDSLKHMSSQPDSLTFTAGE